MGLNYKRTFFIHYSNHNNNQACYFRLIHHITVITFIKGILYKCMIQFWWSNTIYSFDLKLFSFSIYFLIDSSHFGVVRRNTCAHLHLILHMNSSIISNSHRYWLNKRDSHFENFLRFEITWKRKYFINDCQRNCVQCFSNGFLQKLFFARK